MAVASSLTLPTDVGQLALLQVFTAEDDGARERRPRSVARVDAHSSQLPATVFMHHLVSMPTLHGGPCLSC